MARLSIRTTGIQNGRTVERHIPLEIPDDEYLRTLELWLEEGEILPLLQFPFQMDERFYIRLAPDRESWYGVEKKFFDPQLMFDKLSAINAIVNEAIAAGNNSSYIDRIYEVINEAPVRD